MNTRPIYFDHNATTPLRPEVLALMQRYLAEEFGNPSSLHSFGQRAKAGLEEARGRLANGLGCAPEEVHFTSGGTEADNWALLGSALPHRGGRIVTTAIEHHAVLHTCRYLEGLGFEVCQVRPDARGRIDPGAVGALLNERTILVSIMHANNETGVLQPVEEIGRLARQQGVPLHVDAVQSFGKVLVQVDQLGADLVAVSAHKLNGPKGVGALYVRRGTRLKNWTHGGGHEGGRRAGTENVAGIAGFGLAAELTLAEQATRQRQLGWLRDRLEAGILAKLAGVEINGQGAPRLANTLNLSIAGVQSEALLLGLDLEGVAVSSGSACSAGGEAPSHVLLAMGLERKRAAGALRFSLGWGSSEAEVDRVVAPLPGLVSRLRAMAQGI